jgi:hypothetical protein
VKLKDPNPLDVLDLRRVDFCPPHFSTVEVSRKYNIDRAICDWIEDNLSGRYFFGHSIGFDKMNNLTQSNVVGFEQDKEMSFFVLACPHLKYN